MNTMSKEERAAKIAASRAAAVAASKKNWNKPYKAPVQGCAGLYSEK